MKTGFRPEPPLGKLVSGGLSGGCKAGLTLKGDPVLLLPFSTVRSVILWLKVGWVEIMAFVRYISPVEHQVSIWWLW